MATFGQRFRARLTFDNLKNTTQHPMLIPSAFRYGDLLLMPLLLVISENTDHTLGCLDPRMDQSPQVPDLPRCTQLLPGPPLITSLPIPPTDILSSHTGDNPPSLHSPESGEPSRPLLMRPATALLSAAASSFLSLSPQQMNPLSSYRLDPLLGTPRPIPGSGSV